MLQRSPKLSAPALQAHVIPAPVVGQMADIQNFAAHWLRAGPGAGKTQGTRLWLDQSCRPYAWIQLDSLDNDPLAFLEQLRMSLEPLLEPGVQLPVFRPQGGWSLARHCEYLWELTLANLAQASVLVLDDAHLIEDWAQHPVLNQIMLGLDPRLHVVVLSRSDLPDSYARHVINRRIHLLGPDAFVWQASHLRAWLALRWSMPRPSPQFVEALLHISQGGAAVLALLDIEALHQAPSRIRAQAAEQLDLGALMERSLLQRLSSEELEILRWLARVGSFPQGWLTRFPFPAVVRDCVQRWLAGTSVVTQLERTKDELRFHPLFAELLCKGEQVPHAELAPLRTRIIDALLEQERTLDAIELCRDTGQWSRYWEVVQDAAPQWIERGQLGLLQRSLASLPTGVLRDFAGPNLSLFLAAASLHADPVRALAHAKDALANSESEQSWGIWAMALATATNAVIAAGISLDNFEPLVQAFQVALGSDWFAQLPAKLRLSALNAGMVMAMLGREEPPVSTIFSHIQATLEDCDSIELEAATVAAMMRVVVLHGLAEYTEQSYQLVKKLEYRTQTPTAKLWLMNARTYYYLTQGALASCLEAANATLALSRDDAPSIWRVEILAAAAFASANIRALEQTRHHWRELSRLSQGSESSRLLSIHLHSCLYTACLAMHEGDHSSARDYINQSIQSADTLKYPLMQVACRSVSCVIETQLAALNTAKARVGESQRVLANCHIPLAERIVSAMQAWMAVQEQSVEQAIALVTAYLSEMREADAFVQVMGILPQYQELLSFALAHNVEAATVQTIIQRAPLHPKKRPHPRWPSLFEVQSTGRFELRINGKCARDRFVSSGRRFDLLTMLLWYGGRGVSHQRLFEKIWHYIAPDRQLRTMRAGLRRLLADLGREDAILDDGQTLSLNPELWSYDGWALEERLEDPTSRVAALAELRRGFFGPTPIPATMRDEVPSLGSVDLGPKTLLKWLFPAEPPE